MKIEIDRRGFRLTVGERGWLMIGHGGLTPEDRADYDPPRLYINVLWQHLSVDLPIPYLQPVLEISEPNEHGISYGRVVGEQWKVNPLRVSRMGPSVAWRTPAEVLAEHREAEPDPQE